MSSRRGGGGGGRSRNPKDLPRDQQISRKVSWLLRHGAQQEGLTLGKGGYVNVQDALNTRALRTLNISFAELRQVVADNDKQRFSMIVAARLDDASALQSPPVEKLEAEAFDPIPESEEPRDYLIRANQGHSIKVDAEGLLVPITREAGNVPECCVHGTDEAAWRLIVKSGGLRRMGRNHIHFAAGLPKGFTSVVDGAEEEEEKEQPPVISGMRKSSTVLVYVDVDAALEAGIKFFVSENGVVLSEGNEKGFLPYEFFRRVESRKKRGGVLMKDGVLPEGAQVNIEEWEQEVGDVDRGKKRGKGKKARGEKARVNDDSRDTFAGM
ncbi:hypothetical protein EJ04DRAFT_509329 [Polyplosphaeria fusca]|uniref:2'-phosphotransferase n=1 Tax=Polyplosphaeria fusca TaxID=682080 RepID=A0A9P4R8N9_9PLEO|nr:hypothetical protein EJ04DRAFT_509329 [Polyplosphaeria fusca]